MSARRLLPGVGGGSIPGSAQSGGCALGTPTGKECAFWGQQGADTERTWSRLCRDGNEENEENEENDDVLEGLEGLDGLEDFDGFAGRLDIVFLCFLWFPSLRN